MEIKNANSVLKISKMTGSILSYKINDREFCSEKGDLRPLFTLKLLDKNGNPLYCDALKTGTVKFNYTDKEIKINYENIGDMEIDAEVSIRSENRNSNLKSANSNNKYNCGDEIHWHISIDNRTENVLEWIDFPQISVPDDLKGESGDSQLFWPAMEGQVIENKQLREDTWISYREIGGQTGGYCGFYPGSCPMQFMAYYNDDCGLYFAAHDADKTPKTVEFHGDSGGIVLEYRLFCGGVKGKYSMGYDMVTSAFFGDWHDAADIYRDWMEKNTNLPKKIYENDKLPSWLSESPIVVLYPIRGTIDHGDMTPNLYYPYSNILPLTEEFSKKSDSMIMALPMHWEGTAPWATPYVWPPFGGENEFTSFVSALHEQGNLAGVYCSGIGWTTQSFLNPELDFSDKYDESLICRTPSNKIEQSKVIGEPIRLGYDMCPQSDKVAEIVSKEVVSIAKSGCDYAQYFDQNLGGQSCFCYAQDHGHPSAPGIWQNDAMIKIFEKVTKALDDVNSNMLIGCEGAAAEPFIEYLPFNDLRYNIGFFFGKPVPAYAYLFHEYLNNFMGNQNTIQDALDLNQNPDCVLFRIAYSFVAGDLLTVALGDKGKIHWGWDVPWNVNPPRQDNIFALMKNLNAWRRCKKEYLHFGKMCKPNPILGVGEFSLKLKSGYETKYSSLLTSRWSNSKGGEGQVIVNYLGTEQKFRIDGTKVFLSPDIEGVEFDGELSIPPYSAIFVE